MIIRPLLLAHTRNERGRDKDGTTDVDRRRHRQRRDDSIVDITGERWRDNLTAVVGLLSVVGRTASPLPPAGSGGAFFAVLPATTVPQANTAKVNEDNCARAEDARDEWGHREDAHRDRGRRQEEAPAEEGQPDRGLCGRAAA